MQEELGVDLDVTDLLVLDWAPHPNEGDKLLVIFRGTVLTDQDLAFFRPSPEEIVEARFFDVPELERLMPARLARRIAEAARQDDSTYLEHGRSRATATDVPSV